MDVRGLRELAEIVHKADKTEITMVVVTLLAEILDQLKAIREANETETVEDAEPDPFQTLNGPSKPMIDPDPWRLRTPEEQAAHRKARDDHYFGRATLNGPRTTP